MTSKRIGFWLGIGAFVLMCLLPPPADLSREGWITLALLALMVCWWVSEALPIGITSLLPLVIAPMFMIIPLPAAAARLPIRLFFF